MKIDKERFDELKTVIMTDLDFVEFCLIDQKFEDGLWYVSYENRIAVFGKDEGDDNGAPILKNIDPNKFLDSINGLEVKARIFTGWSEGREQREEFDDYGLFSKAIGISSLVAVSTKLPNSVDKKLKYFANREGKEKSAKIREIVYGYVEQQIRENAKDLMFKESI